MRITLRLIVSLAATVALVAWFFAYLQVREERRRQEEDLERRSRLVAESLREAAGPLAVKGASAELQRLVEKFSNRERLEGLAVYDGQGAVLAVSSHLSSRLPPAKVVRESLRGNLAAGGLEVMDGKPIYVYALPLEASGPGIGVLAVFHNAFYIKARLALIWKENFTRLLVQMVLLSLITLLILRWSVAGPIAQMADWMKRLRSGEEVEPFKLPREDLFAPIAREVSTFARHLDRAKSAAEAEARLRQEAEALWTPEKLKEVVKNKLKGRALVVVSNREPYMHVHKGRQVEWIVPAGGLVAALDPVLKATDGLWIAHGSGDADMDVADDRGRLRVPPPDPQYTLKRVALTKEEENGYYYGFANEGVWPLCHIAHTRPMFRPEDWEYYKQVNEKFARATLEELDGMEEPCVLVQDYHFALLPRLIKEKRPDARVALFWHIPWPNPEAFGICPWRKELLYGMMGADLVGFHIQFHCNNFLDTVDRTLECRIDWERFAVNKDGHTTLVKPFPISVDFPSDGAAAPPADKAALLKELGVKADFLGVGVDRVDYTKGILEKFWGIERFLEKHPSYQGRFTFVELGAPSRTHIKRYHDFLAEVEREADRVNWRFKARQWKPIVFLGRHHEPKEIRPFYRAADLCLVTSLHDGMNLVAKEYVAARSNLGGALVLSRFTGASRELPDALLVNPYDIDQTAEAVRYALEMPAEERDERMRRMRESVREHNIYRWAGNLILELTRVPAAGQAVRA